MSYHEYISTYQVRARLHTCCRYGTFCTSIRSTIIFQKEKWKEKSGSRGYAAFLRVWYFLQTLMPITKRTTSNQRAFHRPTSKSPLETQNVRILQWKRKACAHHPSRSPAHRHMRTYRPSQDAQTQLRLLRVRPHPRALGALDTHGVYRDPGSFRHHPLHACKLNGPPP